MLGGFPADDRFRNYSADASTFVVTYPLNSSDANRWTLSWQIDFELCSVMQDHTQYPCTAYSTVARVMPGMLIYSVPMLCRDAAEAWEAAFVQLAHGRLQRMATSGGLRLSFSSERSVADELARVSHLSLICKLRCGGAL